MPFLIIPYHVDVPMDRVPWANWVLIGVTVFFFPLTYSLRNHDLTPLGEAWMLGGPSMFGIIGHMFVHGGFPHLIGNMLFLFVFGNAVCAKVGNLAYIPIYLGLGALAGLTTFSLSPHQAVGASGAINGIVGMFVVWYVLNDVSCFYAFWIFVYANTGVLAVSSFWIVLLWLGFDIWGVIRGGGNVDYVAHIAGLVGGIILGFVLLLLRWIDVDRGERTLLHVLGGNMETPPKKRGRVRRRSEREF